MKRRLIVLAFAAAAFFAGIYFQHRWPIGRLLHGSHDHPTPAPVTLADLAQLTPTRRLVLVVAGQSNAANYGATRRAAGAGVYAFANQRVYVAIDPLPGADGAGGSIWSRLGAKLMLTGRYDAILIATVAQGSTRAEDWAPGGRLHRQLTATLEQLSAAGLPANFLLWQQGESEAASATASGRDYTIALRELLGSVRAGSPALTFVAADSTYGASATINDQIRQAQRALARLPGAIAGPNLDDLGEAFRRDGIHFNDRGLSAAAELWFQALQPALPQASGKPPAT
ncbi:MAG: sialate O-acetylesterase [Opitutaceae bacterium]